MNTEPVAGSVPIDIAIARETPLVPMLPDGQTNLAPDLKSFRGSYLLYRQKGKGMERMKGSAPPRFRHTSRDSAETEAARLLNLFPESTFVILQEVGRVKLKEASRG